MTTKKILMKALRGGAAALAGGLAFASWAQVPSQEPLLNRVADPPPPGVMLTIDDSGSMQAHYMPEGSEKVNGFTVSLPVLSSMSDLVDVFPGDPLHTGYPGTTIPKGESFGDPTDGTNIFARWFRSPGVNTIFYNPAVLYIPWVQVTQAGNAYNIGRYDIGAVGAALWDPTDITQGTTNLLQTYDIDKNGNGGLTSTWCTDGSTCSSGSKNYHPMLYYLLKANADPNSVTSYDTYDLNTKTIDGSAVGDNAWPTYPGRICTAWSNCCTATACTIDAEQQNFANWFVFYRTRTHLTKGAVSEALTNVNGKIRVALGTINSTGHDIDGQNTDVLLQGMRMLDSVDTAKPPAVANQTLYNVLSGPLGMQHISPAGYTPLRAATYVVGQYFRRTAGPSDPGSPWNTVPAKSGGDTSVLACRRAYMLLTTDGYYNDDVSGYSDVGNVDGTDGPDYSGPAGNQDPLGLQPTRYFADSWYPDDNSQMLADFAMFNYVSDLQPGVDNRVGHSGDDFAFWQHLNMFTVGLGVTGTIDPNKVTDLRGKRGAWGTDKIDDLLHAAVDTHGQFFSAKDSTTLSSALASALGNAASASLKESGVATSTSTLTANTLEYVPTFVSGLWSGDVVALNVNTGIPVWDANLVLPFWLRRNVWTWNGSGSMTFDTSLPASLKSQIDPNDPDDLINFIRGDRSNEGAGKLYRVRNTVLGDFVDSSPVLVLNNLDLGYDNLPVGGSGYRAWVQSLGTRPWGAFVQGANDGMLHAFRSDNGVELYGYVPGAELSNLHVIAQTNYGTTQNYHQDFVDGPQIETHAFIPTRAQTSANWSDLVVGSYGAGAKGLYALDLTDVATPSSYGANTLLWEQTGDADMGYLLTNVAVGVTTGGQWKAFVGNGPDSTNGNAVLLVVDLATGHIDSRVTVDSTGSTGLMGVQLIYNSLRQVTAVYAGDLKGNLWRIEVAADGTPTVGFKGLPFFKAINGNNQVQPISVQPLAVPFSGGGNIVLFGTGKLVTDADRDDGTTQTFYGILDPTLQGGSSAQADSPFAADIVAGTPRAHLQQQVVSVDSSTATKPLDQRLFDVTSNSVDYTTQFGWFMDLAPITATQRVMFPAIQINQFVLVNTVSPAPPPQDACSATPGVSAYFLLPAFTGAQYTGPVWDTNGDGKIDNQDSAAAGYAADAGGKTSIVQNGPGQGENLNPNGGNRDYKVPSGTRTRVWQQLMTPPF
jgi:type IV pilus assembly protein PilY1